MLKSVHYGPHSFAPWCGGSGFVDKDAKSLKSYRSREPQSIWQSLQTKTEDLGEYDVHFCPHCLLYSSVGSDIKKHIPLCRYRHGLPGKKVYEDDEFEVLEICTQGAAAAVAAADAAAAAASSSPSSTSTENTAESSTDTTSNGAAGSAEGGSKSGAGTAFDSVKLYLQCLSLFGHLFLDTKSICFSVDAFLFYVAIEKRTKLVAGFFSKEIDSWHNYNLACIVIFPPWQMRGLGQRLIQLSYAISHHAGKTGSPEKPLSTHGQLAYDRYWARAIVQFCVSERSARRSFTLREISRRTGIDPADLAGVLERTGALDPQRRRLKVSKLVNPSFSSLKKK